MELRVEGLSKTYPNGVCALDQVDLVIKTGMFGLLGPNGAGKSTLMRTLATLQSPDSGSYHFNDINPLADPMALRYRLGYLPQDFGVYPRMSARRLLDYLARLKGITQKRERAILLDYCLGVTNLVDVQHKHVGGYSGGMKQRFGIAQLLLNDPQLIIVDEPTAGLDPTERQRFLNILRDISTKKIVIFSTHIVEDIKDLCTDMAIMNKGQILQHASPEDIMGQLQNRVWLQHCQRSELEMFKRTHRVLSSAFNRNNSLRLRLLSDQSPTSTAVAVAPTLEDAFFAAL